MGVSKEFIQIIDVCCGSGNLAIALAYYNKKCKVYASDISHEAVKLSMENIELHHLEQLVSVKQGDLFSVFEKKEFYEKIDLIICNPPYISSFKVTQLGPEISRNEPSSAFDGGMTGLRVIQQVIREALRFLLPGGWLVIEIGAGQGSFIMQFCERMQSYVPIISVPDEEGIIRVLALQKPIEDRFALGKI